MMNSRNALVIATLCGLAAAPAIGQTDARAYEAELAADAATRSSLLGEGGGAGYEKGKFTIYSGDKANSLWIAGHFQFRYNANFRDEDTAPGANDEFTQGFQMRRTRLRAGGSIWDKNLTYQIQMDVNRATGEWGLVDAYAQYKFENGMTARWGQFKLPFLREENISDSNQLAAEASTTHSVFTQGRSQIVQLEYLADQFRLTGAFSDGFNTLNTDFDSAREADFALTGRADWMFAGDDFKRFDDFTSFRSQDYTGMLGAAFHYQDGGETGGTPDQSLASAVIDTQVEGQGWNIYAAGIWRNVDAASASEDFNDFGMVLQAGYFVSDQTELFARLDITWADDNRAASDATDDTFHTVTGGVNYYISPESQAVKFTADVQYFFNPEADLSIVSPTTGTGLLADGEDGQIQLRLQMQVMF